MSDQSDLVEAAISAREILRVVAKNRTKFGSISTHALQTIHQINHALLPFKGLQPEEEI